jgi:RND family efflux transporter MFP subunit
LFIPARLRSPFIIFVARPLDAHLYFHEHLAMTKPPLFQSVLFAAVLTASGCGGEQAAEPAQLAAAAKPALTVEAVAPTQTTWSRSLTTSGDITAWQEASIGAEIGNYRLTEVSANVGDRVKKGQLLARISDATVAAELAETRATVAEAEAALSEASANAERARRLRDEGFYSAQTGSQFITGEQTARARLDAARARVKADELRLAHTRVLASDDGVISARTATVGSLAQPGQELFRLIRNGRLEWRAKVAEADLGRIKPGQIVTLTLPDGGQTAGKVRIVAPSVNMQTRDGLVYVDLSPAPGDPARAGMFARGEFALGQSPALTLPQTAVVTRDGFAYVYRLDKQDANGQAKAIQTKVETGRRVGEQVEIVAGLADDARVVASGAGFLADGDMVRVVAGK